MRSEIEKWVARAISEKDIYIFIRLFGAKTNINKLWLLLQLPFFKLGESFIIILLKIMFLNNNL